MMNQLIGLLLPSIIALKMHNKLEEKEENLKKQIERYLIYVMIVNTISYIITIYIFKQPNIVFTYLFTVKYVILALVVSIIIPVIEKFILTNMEVEIKVEKNEEITCILCKDGIQYGKCREVCTEAALSGDWDRESVCGQL